MRVCFISYGYFPDGPVTRPVPESDAINIPFALGGDFLSFFSVRRLTGRQLLARLRDYDLVIATLEDQTVELIQRLLEAAPGRVATYSEGSVGQYQALDPARQAAYVAILRAALVNFVYWEKYVSFYTALADRPAVYLPYPFVLEAVQQYATPVAERQRLAVVPTGLAGHTRNGLASLTVLRHLLESELVEAAHCWPDAHAFGEDAQACAYILFPKSGPPVIRRDRFPWRRWLFRSRVDYRRLLQLRNRLRPPPTQGEGPVISRVRNVTFFRRTSWPVYLRQLAQAQILVDLNNRETVGRNALDCAALGIPCLSTDRSDMQARLFPETTLADSWDIPGALEVARQLLTQPDFYQAVTAQAAERVLAFTVPAFQQHFATVSSQLSGLKN